ncbi:MAG: bifunctional proline dehydrogenase/L-glutamate gamma-semialdehyde dehydrogenase [Verrucomicrobiae bacterium]|nr:bifunctional proline dehydrogenase/L-glutamate gamma-semialdehyde dehydrogenase [Verrucomicrobiae bacterium]NNJ43841.1 bifunctional proline dehydrogenase/L-glutamate gamma-semialdehyde dehydrogenase [Akkermansiaceae bacterium]
MTQRSIPTLLNDVKDQSLSAEQVADLAVELAGEILSVANENQKVSERYQGWKMARMMHDPMGKTLTLAMADQVFRSPTDSRSASQFRYLVGEYGVPSYLPLHEQVAMRMGVISSAVAPDVVMPAITWKMRGESSEVILPSEDDQLIPHLKKRKKQGIRMNINQLGEAILGEEEAGKRMDQVVARLESPDCEYISVKISAIFSQINLVAYDQTLEEIKTRLRRLYRAAQANTFLQNDGTHSPKFVNLDMEEYRDLHLTCDAFQQVLMEEEFLTLRAGIVLQAYLPDSHEVQKRLTVWARERVDQGGATIKIRIVKGANLAMEEVEASLHDWELAPYPCKADVDANYKRMVHYGCHPENAEVVQLGIASHNLFEITYAMILRAGNGVEKDVEFEMLEGMANHQARAVRDAVDGLLLYAPVVKKEDFHSAIAYLVRRLDENTAEENFLHDIFGMKKGDKSWKKQREMFLNACKHRDEVSTQPARTQDRNTEEYGLDVDAPFHNAADTDWSLRHNMRWILKVVEDYRAQPLEPIPVQIGGEFVYTEETKVGRDPSCPEKEAYRFSGTDTHGVDRALQCATDAQPAWEARSIDERAKLLKQAAVELANARGACIAATMLDGGKAAPEADGEVSEAIDFANYYADSMSDPAFFDGTESKALGVVVITPPWNFPFAIPCGGVLAALMAGNTVILKPASEAVLCSWVMVELLWKAGIPKEVLQFVMCADRSAGQQLVSDERTSGVILTGGYATARMFQDWKPEMRLFAETSGKNSLVITSAADPDQAVKDLVKSAFGHAGQKCSAASLAIIEADLYDDPAFIRQLRDAAASLKVGPSWDPSSIVTPVIHKPDADLDRGLTTLDDGETWLLEPEMIDHNPCLWSPGIKLGVAPDSWYRRTECFGPVLGLVRANDLDHAIRIQNDSDFGLTGGIHSLDAREIAIWRDRVEVGNAYINRSTTGAIVQRQPFGGWKKSCFGPGAKAGGPNYVSIMATWSEMALPKETAAVMDTVQPLLESVSRLLPDETETLQATAGSYARWWREEFSIEHDPSQLHGESNHFRYRAHDRILLRATGMSDLQLAQVCLAATTCGSEIDISVSEKTAFTKALPFNIIEESEAALIARLPKCAANYGILRVLSPSTDLQRVANNGSLQTITSNPLANGRLELLTCLREQAVSETTHRYGNVIPSAETILNGLAG